MTNLTRRGFATGLSAGLAGATLAAAAPASALDLPQIVQPPSDAAMERHFSLFDGAMKAPKGPFLMKNGSRGSLRDYPGRTVVATFWATWCGPCAREMPELGRLARDHPEVVLIPLALDREESISKIEKFYRRHRITTLRPMIDMSQSLARKLRVPGTPTSVVIDGGGGIRAVAVGNVDWRNADVRAYLTSLS